MRTRILLADDHELIRAGLRAMLEKDDGLEVVAEAGDGRSAVQLAVDLRPDVVVMDISMPGLNGIEATRLMLARVADLKVIALSMHADRQFVTAMLDAGASAYLLKDCAPDELAFALRAVVAGRVYLTPKVADVVVNQVVRQPRAAGGQGSTGAPREASAFDVLTAREREVLQLIAEGKTTKEIAAALHIGAKTVETHRAQLMNKLNLHGVAPLTKYAIRHGLTSLEIR